MRQGDPELTLEHRDILENRTIGGEWNCELVARTPRVFEEGDLLFGFSGGGPGYGDPLEREPEAVLQDLRKGIVSDWTVRNVYCVAYDSERGKLDAEATSRLRDEERRARLRRGKRFDEFLVDWSKGRPPEDILEWYGSWPDAQPLGPVFRP
jgi:acetophenone carboxylase